MGSVHKEQVNEGLGTHETFDYTTFSDRRVVDWLIKNRQKLDNATMVFNEQIAATYVSQDMTIKDAALTKQQAAVISLLMDGWTISDIAEEFEISRQAVDVHFHKAVRRIMAANDRRWHRVFAKVNA